MRHSSPAALSPRWLPAALVVLLGLLASVLLYREQDARLTAIEQARFEQQATQVSQALQQRLASDTEVVYGLRGLFVANPALTRAQFQRAAEELAASSRTPGLVSLAFTRRVAQADREAFEQQVRADRSLRADGNPGFAIHPSVQRSEYFVADFLWPIQGNEAVLGLDISSQPANLEAMQYARDTGQVVVSAAFPLLQEILRSPRYRHSCAGIRCSADGGRNTVQKAFSGRCGHDGERVQVDAGD
ncbi:MAG: CHASE domain-containing protein [Giesbergeria sp.]